jgi:hypothetical protein
MRCGHIHPGKVGIWMRSAIGGCGARKRRLRLLAEQSGAVRPQYPPSTLAPWEYPVKAPEGSLARLSGLIGEDTDLGSLTREQARQVLQLVVENEDDALLDALYFRVGGDQRLIPSTPAWIWLKGGQLAVVYDRVVFFQERLWSQECRHLFSIPTRDLHVEEWTRSRWIGSRGFTLVTPSKRHRISLLPPRGTNLTEVSGAPETPVLEGVAGLFEATGGLLEILGPMSEAFSLRRTRKVAKVHDQIWRMTFNRLAAGERAPFDPAPTVSLPQGRAPEPVRHSITSLRPNPRRDRVLELIREHPGITVKQLGELTDTDPSRLYTPVRVLVENQLVLREGRALHAGG